MHNSPTTTDFVNTYKYIQTLNSSSHFFRLHINVANYYKSIRKKQYRLVHLIFTFSILSVISYLYG